ncbi:MAG: hypothetical protein GY869_09405 [Planctomycetes bacterium]|nr:hypothetical protein [Planctomycetota bacterium]
MNRKRQWFLIVVAGILAGGCLPEDYSEWSDDGSVGIMKIGDALWLVDGEGERTAKIDEGGEMRIGVYPTISADGKMAAYEKAVKYEDMEELLAALPEGQVNMVKQAAAEMREEIEREGGLKDDKFPKMEAGTLGHDDSGQRDLVIRYLCETADDNLKMLLGEEVLTKGRENEINLYHLYVVNLHEESASGRRLVATKLLSIWPPRIAPNKKYVAYLVLNSLIENGDLIFDLYVASLEEDVPAMLIKEKVSYGYSWRDDSRALAYLVQEEDGVPIGTLQMTMVADEQGKLLAKPTDKERTAEGSLSTHQYAGDQSDRVGILWQALMKTQYGPGGRIFFSGGALSIPMSLIDDELQMSIFCYDPVTKAVTDVLPSQVSGQLGDTIGLFDISPDHKRILLPMKRHRFLIYEFGKSEAVSPITEDSGFQADKDDWKMAPSWRGNEEICCLVDKDSDLLRDEEVKTDEDYVRVIIDIHGELVRIVE